MIRIRYYGMLTGNFLFDCAYSSIEEAFNDMVRGQYAAIASPVGSSAGAYMYDPRKQDHTLELFTKVMECCCNDINEFRARKAALGI